ncbi:MAG: tetratricopeptide repeat protein [Hyphomicrobiales bacterium]|nr:tetratricopeptide repeat protein [Hyphomicrobiales bacterium]
MADIFQEVDEDLRRDKTVAFLQKNRVAIAAAALLFLAGAAGWRLWSDHVRAQAAAGSLAYEDALGYLRDGKSDLAKNAFERIAATAPAGYRGIAAMSAAGAQAAKDPAGAAAAFDAVAADPSVDPPLAEAARLRAGYAWLDADKADEAAKRFTALAAGGVWADPAREALGLIALDAKDYAGAGKWIDEVVTDPAATASQRQRAEALLALVRGAQPTKP